MTFKVIFRQNRNYNHFREWMIRALNYSGADTAVICSGFFQENFRGSRFGLTNDRRFIAATKSKEIITIGIHNNTWLPSYRNFRNNFYRHNPNITALVSNRMRWHAKVFLLISKGQPCFAIVGSSNMTSSAFGSPRIVNNFNYEADVVIWNSSNSKVSNYFSESFPELLDSDIMARQISLSYKPEDNFGRSELDRLHEIEEMLMESLNNFRILD